MLMQSGLKILERLKVLGGKLDHDPATGLFAYDVDGNGKKTAILMTLFGVIEQADLQASDVTMI